MDCVEIQDIRQLAAHSVSESNTRGRWKGWYSISLFSTTDKIKTYVSSVQPHVNSINCSLDVDGEQKSFLTDAEAQISRLVVIHQSVQRRLMQIKSVSMKPVIVDGTPIPFRGKLTVTIQIACHSLLV